MTDLFETEAVRDRAAVVETLERTARQLEDGVLHLRGRSREHRISVPERTHMELELEREPTDDGIAYELEIEITWTDSAPRE